MNVLQKCCSRSLRENRKRTLVTIVGVILATALITGVACLATSFRASMVAYEKKQNGDWHYCFQGVKPENLKYFQENHHLERVVLKQPMGYAVLEGSQNQDKPYVYLCAVGEDASSTFGLQLTQGRMPENSSELVISRHIQYNGMVGLQIGDSITLELGQRVSEGYPLGQSNVYLYEEETLEIHDSRTYTIVGVIERPNYNVEDRIAPGYSVFTCLEDPMEAESLEVYASYTGWGLKHAKQVTEGLETLADSVENNYYLLKWLLFIFSSTSMDMIYAMSVVAMLIIVVTSVFCIHNSFTISLTEKMKLYGRLASVGTTARQQRKIVYYEALFLGGVGIPLGIVSGILSSVILVRCVSSLMEDAIDIPLVFGISWMAVILSVLLACVTIFLSAWRSARRAAKISPISAIRANATVKIRSRELRCPRWISGLFGIGGKVAYKNLRRARVKYRATVVSIVVGVAVFIGMTTFMQSVRHISDVYYEDMQYQLRITCYDSDGYNKLLTVTQMDGVEEAELIRTGYLSVPCENLPLTEDYRELYHNEDSTEESIRVFSLGAEGYARYCSRVGVSPEQNQAIVLAQYEYISYDEKDIRHEANGYAAYFNEGDLITGEGEALSLSVAVQTDIKPVVMNRQIYNGIVLIVSEGWMDENWEKLRVGDRNIVETVIRCEDAFALEEAVRGNMELVNYSIVNYEESHRAEKSTQLLVSIFLYGFITVVALIGITNIFNTITTNLELRAPEFAMLRAVGMTSREFRRMIWLESLFYGCKALAIGIPLGIAVSYCFNLAMKQGIDTAFLFPWSGILIAVTAVMVLLYGTMHYSMGKIRRKNIVETIRSENL
ncbi:MAG: ABC transporter permease [bacterium]|nr:ABC transporter permease [bacterium]MCM1376748.1 ABC transporter permease [Muribaculum sp.]